MDPTAVLAQIITGIVLIITTIGSVILQIITAKSVARIDGHVNSEKTASEGRELTLVAKNELLQKLMEEQKATANLLAQAAAVVQGRDTPAAPVATARASPVLASIERNTAETADNTKRVEEKVDAIAPIKSN